MFFGDQTEKRERSVEDASLPTAFDNENIPKAIQLVGLCCKWFMVVRRGVSGIDFVLGSNNDGSL